MYTDHGSELMPKAQVLRWGKSLAVRIPKGVAEQARMKEGDAVVIKAAEGRIELRHSNRIPSLEDLVAQITPENRHAETDCGPDVGGEKIKWGRGRLFAHYLKW